MLQPQVRDAADITILYRQVKDVPRGRNSWRRGKQGSSVPLFTHYREAMTTWESAFTLW